MKYGKFSDPCRGNGWHISAGKWTLAFRNRWHFYFVRVHGKPGVSRIYMGLVEIEYRGQQS